MVSLLRFLRGGKYKTIMFIGSKCEGQNFMQLNVRTVKPRFEFVSWASWSIFQVLWEFDRSYFCVCSLSDLHLPKCLSETQNVSELDDVGGWWIRWKSKSPFLISKEYSRLLITFLSLSATSGGETVGVLSYLPQWNILKVRGYHSFRRYSDINGPEMISPWDDKSLWQR